ncbi:MAG TPA: hypothetical protein PKJ99_02440 [Thermoanaerobaculales bacterium]|nr:hypothetical protein [Thermoanaerobaculales bacterium]
MSDDSRPPELSFERLHRQYIERYRPQGEIERRAVDQAAREGYRLRTEATPEGREAALESLLQTAERISRLQRERRERSRKR